MRSCQLSIMKKSRKAIYVLACGLALGSGLSMPAEASRPMSPMERDFDKAFQEMLSDPADVDKTMHYAELAVKLNDYEAAIPPLERILMYNPDLPEIRLEVGVLYFLLNSHTVAKKYLMEVKNDGKADASLKKRADEYLARM